MATQIITRQATESVGPDLSEKATNFFSSAAELFELYFESPKRLDILDERVRTQLTVQERVAIDQPLHSIGPY